MSQHAKQLIVQFMAACCGRSTDTGTDELEENAKESGEVPDNDLSLQRTHAIIDGMSKEEEETTSGRKKIKGTQDSPADVAEDDVPEDPNVSSAVKDALITTGQLWRRETGDAAVWAGNDRRHSSLEDKTLKALSKTDKNKKKRQAKKKMRKIYEEKVYMSWKECKEEEWWQKSKASDEPPTEEQETFLRCVLERCREERQELATQHLGQILPKAAAKQKQRPGKSSAEKKLSEAKRICLFGIP